ncbi:MAG: 4Fe-4S binding protein [Cellulosilyticaceae bacterium]
MKKNNKIMIKEYMWILSSVYLILGFFNILFAWIGLLCFFVPLLLSIFGKGKVYCNQYCGRGQLLDKLGKKLKLSRHKPIPSFIKSKWFRYGFLAFFMTMFSNMIYITYLVFNNTKQLKEVVTLLWTFKLPWQWAAVEGLTPWVSQFAFGFYSVMLTSTVLGIITMILYKPRSWCVYCPMGTMTQEICRLKNKGSQ